MRDQKKLRPVERKAICIPERKEKGEPRSLRAHGAVVEEAEEEERALRLVGCFEKRGEKTKRTKWEGGGEKRVRKSRNRGRDARGLGGRRPIRLTVRSGGVVASGGRNAFWLRASERPCRSEVMEVLWWWWQGGSRGEGSRSFFTSPL